MTVSLNAPAGELMETSLSVLAAYQAFLPHQFMTEKQISSRFAAPPQQ